MPFEQEIETYERELPHLLFQEGKYAVIAGPRVLGAYVSYQEALQMGYEICGLGSFLVKKIESEEQVQGFTRDLVFLC